jgi:uncharacterized protein (TIGR03435 family)
MLSHHRKIKLTTVARTAEIVTLLLVVAFAARLPAQSPQATAAERPTFEAVSIKVNKSQGVGSVNLTQPGGHLTATNVSLKFLIIQAYQFAHLHFASNPEGADWIETEHFDIAAVAQGNPTLEQKRLMIQSLLADRFKLTMHHEPRQLPEYALVMVRAGRTGPQLRAHRESTKCVDVPAGQPSPSPDRSAALQPSCGGIRSVNGDLAGQNVTMEKLAETLSILTDRNVVNRTGLRGNFDLTLKFQARAGDFGLSPSVDPDPSGPPSIFTALQEQLGLKLDSTTGPVDVIFIDHVERPSEN